MSMKHMRAGQVGGGRLLCPQGWSGASPAEGRGIWGSHRQASGPARTQRTGLLSARLLGAQPRKGLEVSRVSSGAPHFPGFVV